MKTLIAILFFSVLVACSIFSKEASTALTKPLTAADTNREIVLSQGHLFHVVLPSNPTTGYSWNSTVDNATIVSVDSKKYVADVSNRIGVGGETTWTLRTHKKGNAKITFSYQRPWEENTAPTREVTFSISVR